MKKILLLITFLIIGVFASADTAFAEIASGSSAKIQPRFTESVEDNRVVILRNFLAQYDSPLTEYADVFVETADKYQLDWKFVAAISGVESTFGKHIPYNSYNGWGWGVYGTNVHRFESWEDGIETVSKGLRENYMNKWGATDVYSVGKIYAASPAWAGNVTLYMNRIDKFVLSDTKNSLSLSI